MSDARWKQRVAILGSPDRPPDFSAAALARLVDLGFDTLQVNIAWLSRPHDEPLNLCDVVAPEGETPAPRVAARQAELARRVAAAKSAGLRTLFHVGTPYMWRDPASGSTWQPDDPLAFDRSGPDSRRYDTQDPAVTAHETSLVTRLRDECPGIDDLLVYTFDQDAWQASEFGASPLSRGVPLTERLSAYLHALHEAWTGSRVGHALYWEPWELSAGQVLTMIPHLPRDSFGLMVHGNIAEVQLALPGDVWLRNCARMAAEIGIPVVVEAFLAERHEEIEPCRLPTPGLVDEQVRILEAIDGITGIKEYYGLEVDRPDLNLAVASARLRGVSDSAGALVERALDELSLPPRLRSVVDDLDDAYRLVPWDTSWFMRKLGRGLAHHGWDAAILRGEVISTPAWDSTRRAHFMKTDDLPPHLNLMEDVHLRIEAALAHFFRAGRATEALIDPNGDAVVQDYLTGLVRSIDVLARALQAFSLHLRETIVATVLREDLSTLGRPCNDRLVDEMLGLLARDVVNSHRDPATVRAHEVARADLAGFLATHLVPRQSGSAPLGLHSLTTI